MAVEDMNGSISYTGTYAVETSFYAMRDENPIPFDHAQL